MVGSEKKSFVFAYYVTGHGFGHATRVVEVVRNLIQAGHEVHVVTGAPDYVYTIETQSPRLFIRKVLLDCGAVQADALTVDRLASLEKYNQTAVLPRDSILATEVEWLKSVKADLVISDVVPVACRAAADAGIRAVCCTNFSWDFIYADYVMASGYHNRSIIWQIAEDYSHCEFVIRLPGYCPMPAFRDVIDVPLVVRRFHKTREKVREELGILDSQKVLIYNFGGQPAGWKLKKEYLPEGWICLVAARILQDTAIGKHHTSHGLSGARRLRDAIVLGYQLQRITGKDIAIPEWYSLAQNELSSRTQLPNKEVLDSSSLTRQSDYFTILHGDHQGLQDTLGFLKSLAEMESSGRPQNNNKLQTREHLAASAIFNWEEEIFVSRAPGRLDVMGGIADYSGSLVLQMPTRESCHVAIQRNHPSKHKLWKHAQARQPKEGPTAVLQIVSFGSELGNRGPTFDMDLSDFVEDGQPITYEKAYNYFTRDPAQKWAAYVAGTILVLMTELGIHFEDSISILVSSGVPEGKGVSSSAAIEVASMTAVAAAHGLNIDPRHLALLCQKVENHIVGAPCGVMDQMASACGEANKLLAMVCQPAEVLGLVDIPPTIRFWGIDSGIRHSVGGSDYKSVRVGAFMGRKIIKSLASVELCSSLSNISTPQQINGFNPDDVDEDGKNLLETEASLDYLCNLSAHRYEASYATRLPESLSGQEFVEKYLDHDDSVTTIDKERNYAVRAPTRHPIYENFRVKAFKALLSASPSNYQLSALGELMYQCHFSYSACGLGSNGTDRLVNLVQEMQHSKSSESEGGTLFGAKITGGGSGGTVCVIGRNCLRSNEQLIEIQQRYKASTGFSPYVFEGSSPGAAKFGYLKIHLPSSSKS
ncbi:L-arabinokinase-like isoform X4 [Solanum dulcamara]|uniref:L-arabinokinase-like isoform X4 n=1 Tax=Solanum dulcamara TaxID=45834 RepID=UPI002484E01D|nr:L-arabinokinase-like isoform X4 [Solanum dulcamara]